MKTVGLPVAVSLAPVIAAASEAAHNTAFCMSIGGETEARHYYDYPTGRS